MKKIIIFTSFLFFSPLFASETIDETSSIAEVYASGYMLKATVVAERGIVVSPDSQVASANLNNNDSCFFVTENLSKPSILRTGRVITFPEQSLSLVNDGGYKHTEDDGYSGYNDAIKSSLESNIVGIDFASASSSANNATTAEINNWCSKLNFEIIVNDYLEDL